MCTPVFVRVELILILCRIEFWVLLFQKKPKNREKKEEKEEKRKERTPQNKHFLCCPTTQTNKQQARI